jgi:hypothetical protein
MPYLSQATALTSVLTLLLASGAWAQIVPPRPACVVGIDCPGWDAARIRRQIGREAKMASEEAKGRRDLCGQSLGTDVCAKLSDADIASLKLEAGK